MITHWIPTRVRIPPPARHSIPRPRLVDILEREIPHSRVTVVSAPAGYGKTTLLAQWANQSQLPVAWLTLSRDENDHDTLFRNLVAAWEAIDPAVHTSTLGILVGSKMPDREAIQAAFIAYAGERDEETIFVLDECHLVEAADVYESLAFILDNLPPTAHFVFSGRSEPRLPLSRYRARRELLELRTEDLQFVLEETRDFFAGAMNLQLPDEQLAEVHATLEGWIAGFQLIALGRRRGREALDLAALSGRQRYISDYLADDVVAGLPDDTRAFLLQTSILDRMCADLCNAVTERNDSQQMLEQLERENLFLLPLDDMRDWYRYHRLFGEFLRVELERRNPDEVTELHRRAGRWHLHNDMPDDAMRHALACQADDLVLEIFERYFYAKLLRSELGTLQRWLAAVPLEWIATHPMLGLARSGMLMFRGDLDGLLQSLAAIDEQLDELPDEEQRPQRARVTAIRCYIACFQGDIEQAQAHADLALQFLPKRDLDFRAGIYGALGDTYRAHGRWQDAYTCYRKMLDFTDAPAFSSDAVHVYGALADLSLMQGRLRDANSYWQDAFAVIRDRTSWGYLPLADVGWAYTRYAELLYEWNELDPAREHLQHGMERAELAGDVRGRIAGCLLSARLLLTAGETDLAAGYVDQARPLVEHSPFTEWAGRFNRLQVELWIEQGRLRTADNWIDRLRETEKDLQELRNEATRLALARVLVVREDAPALNDALDLLAHLREWAEAEGRGSVQVEALALQALALWNYADKTGALTALDAALRLAEPEGYIRTFADLGLPMVRLLQEARSRGVMDAYIDRLLPAFGTFGEAVERGTMTTSLLEPLTRRESEILALLAAGLTNNEIAEKLFLSPETVKKHTGNIYGKLGVRRRTEAVARARSLDLLP